MTAQVTDQTKKRAKAKKKKKSETLETKALTREKSTESRA
jgi:hypothetical protein